MSDKQSMAARDLREALSGLPEEFHAFADVFDEQIRPALQKREADRALAAKRAVQCRWAAGGIAVLGVLGWFAFGEFWIAIAGGVIAMLVVAGGEYALNKLAKEAKALIVVPIAEKFGLRFTISPGPVPSIQQYRTLNLVPGWDRAKYEDLITGQRRGVDFELFEAHLEERRTSRDSRGNTRTSWVTVFKGQCLRLDFHKNFYGRTLIARDAGFFNRFNAPRGMQRAGLEDPVFERIFEVYTTDQVESRYLLTPDLMQRLVDLENTFKGGKLKACFEGGEMFITVEGGDLFEPGCMFRPLDSADRIKELLNDFNAVFNIIDEVTAGQIRVEAHHP